MIWLYVISLFLQKGDTSCSDWAISSIYCMKYDCRLLTVHIAPSGDKIEKDVDRAAGAETAVPDCLVCMRCGRSLLYILYYIDLGLDLGLYLHPFCFHHFKQSGVLMLSLLPVINSRVSPGAYYRLTMQGLKFQEWIGGGGGGGGGLKNWLVSKTRDRKKYPTPTGSRPLFQ